MELKCCSGTRTGSKMEGPRLLSTLLMLSYRCVKRGRSGQRVGTASIPLELSPSRLILHSHSLSPTLESTPSCSGSKCRQPSRILRFSNSTQERPKSASQAQRPAFCGRGPMPQCSLMSPLLQTLGFKLVVSTSRMESSSSQIPTLILSDLSPLQLASIW